MSRINSAPISDEARARFEYIDPVTDITDHAAAFATLLEKAAMRIRHGVSPEDEARQLLDIIRVAARHT